MLTRDYISFELPVPRIGVERREPVAKGSQFHGAEIAQLSSPRAKSSDRKSRRQVVGILMGFALIMVEVKSPMLFSVGMYLPLGTTFAIFVGGLVRWMTDKLCDRRGFNDAQKARVDNAGVLTASGLIAGEALCGLAIAALVGTGHDVTLFKWTAPFVAALIALAVLIVVMIQVPLRNAGRPDEPAPPTAIM